LLIPIRRGQPAGRLNEQAKDYCSIVLYEVDDTRLRDETA